MGAAVKPPPLCCRPFVALPAKQRSQCFLTICPIAWPGVSGSLRRGAPTVVAEIHRRRARAIRAEVARAGGGDFLSIRSGHVHPSPARWNRIVHLLTGTHLPQGATDVRRTSGKGGAIPECDAARWGPCSAGTRDPRRSQVSQVGHTDQEAGPRGASLVCPMAPPRRKGEDARIRWRPCSHLPMASISARW